MIYTLSNGIDFEITKVGEEGYQIELHCEVEDVTQAVIAEQFELAQAHIKKDLEGEEYIGTLLGLIMDTASKLESLAMKEMFEDSGIGQLFEAMFGDNKDAS